MLKCWPPNYSHYCRGCFWREEFLTCYLFDCRVRTVIPVCPLARGRRVWGWTLGGHFDPALLEKRLSLTINRVCASGWRIPQSHAFYGVVMTSCKRENRDCENRDFLSLSPTFSPVALLSCWHLSQLFLGVGGRIPYSTVRYEHLGVAAGVDSVPP